jgi:hypothetical protein
MRYKLKGALLLVGVFLMVGAAAAQEDSADIFREHNAELLGQIYLVEPAQSVLVVEKDAIPYSFYTNSDTFIIVNERRGDLEELAFRRGQVVSVKFRVTRRGNIAREIVVPFGIMAMK